MTRVLIADDHRFLRSGVEALLRDAGHTVVASVSDGEEALAVLDESDPEVVILDVRMPNLGGAGVLQAMRRGGDLRPVIVLAAEIDDDDLVAIMQAGANAILFKHSAEEGLLDAIAAVSGGQSALPADLVARAMGLAGRPRLEDALSRLNRRERQIVERVVRGQRNRDIADELEMTEGTVKSYLHNVYGKLGVANRTELASLVLGEKTA